MMHSMAWASEDRELPRLPIFRPRCLLVSPCVRRP